MSQAAVSGDGESDVPVNEIKMTGLSRSWEPCGI